MRKVIYSSMVSLDGFVKDQNRNLDWIRIDEELHTFVNEQHHEIDTFLFGRRMYEVMVSWETIGHDASQPEYILEFARIWQNIHKIVFSTTLDHVEGDATLNRGNIVDEIARLKTLPGKDMSVGGATLAAILIQSGLIDEYQLFINPVILGSGTPIFHALDHQTNIRLIETKTFSSGVVFLRYQPAGKASQEK